MKTDTYNYTRIHSIFSRMAVQNISESVYDGLCLKIVTPQQVASRRDIVDIVEMMKFNKMLNKPFTVMLSGSRREGFRFSESDVDYIHWQNNHRLIWDFSQVEFNNTQEHALILCDS